MSEAVCNNCGCPTPVVVQIPGAPGSAGTNGANGKNAFSIVQTAFTVPAISSSVSVIVDDNSWMQVNAIVFESSSGYYQVASLAGTTVVGLTYLNYSGNSESGNTVPIGAQLSPTGSQADVAFPISVADGGTNATDAPTALTNLGAAASGANTDITSIAGLTTALSIAQGGTGQTTAAAALTALGAKLTLVTAAVNGASAVTVTAASVTADSTIIFTLKTVGGTVGAYPAIQTITPGTGFTFKGTSGDTSTMNILIIN